MLKQLLEKKKRDKQAKQALSGNRFIKHGRYGKPHQRLVCLNSTKDAVVYRDPNNPSANNKTILFTDITEIKKDAQTKVFEKNIPNKDREKRGEKCFSFIATKRTLDLECSSKEERDAWFDIFDHIYGEWKQSQSQSGNSKAEINRKKEIEKCAEVLKKFGFEIESDSWKVSKVLLKSTKFAEEDYLYLQMCMEKNTVLTTLDLADMNISDQALQYLCNGIQQAENLTHLNLSGNYLTGDGIIGLGKVLKNHKCLKVLDLGSNQISEFGMSEFCFSLGENKSIEELYLDKNSIGDDGACALSDSLSVHETMKIVSVRQNQISNKGIKSLAEILKKNKNNLKMIRMGNNQVIYQEKKNKPQQEEDDVDEDEGDSSLEVELFIAVDSNSYAEMVLLLIQGADVNVQNEEDGKTPLHLAAIRGDLEVVEFLTDHPHIDLNLKDDNTNTALFLAMENKRYDIAKFLLEKGADFRIGDKHKKTVLHLACEQGEKALVKLLIETYKDDLTVITTSEITPLHLAAQNLHRGVVEYLLMRDEKERKDYYSQNKSENCEEEVIAYVNWQDVLGETALHKVFNNGKHDLEIAKLLIKKGANIGIEDNHGRVAIADVPEDVKKVLLNEARIASSARSMGSMKY